MVSTLQAARDLRVVASGTGVVIGGSMAGLLAARALAGVLDRVVLVERDRFPDGPAFRAGVPQSRHAHALLERGLRVLERLFPGIEADLREAGAVPLQFPGDALWQTAAGWSRRFRPGRHSISASRELLEWAVRRRVLALPNVELREHCDAAGLQVAGGVVTGVRLRDRDATLGGPGRREQGETLAAGFVVDASGRDSRAPFWLEELGYGRPQETRIDARFGYASRLYAPPPGFAADWKLLFLQREAHGNTRTGVLLPVEGGRWMVTLVGVGDDCPPIDEEGFLAFARGLRSAVLYEAIRGATPLSPIHGYRRTENQRRHYERFARWPEGFVVLGDAACAFNPAYGQGMSVAAVEAQLLAETLEAARREGRDLAAGARTIQRRVARAHADAWLIATSEDLRHATTAGGRVDLRTQLSHRYLDRAIRVGTVNAGVNDALGRVLHLLAPPSSLFAPRVLLPVLFSHRNPPIAPPVAMADERPPAPAQPAPAPSL